MAVNPTITAYTTPTAAYTVGQTDAAYFDIDLSDLTNDAELFVTCPLDAQVHAWTLVGAEATVRWVPAGAEAALLTGGAWVASTTVGPWSVTVAAGTPSVVTVTATDPGDPETGPLRLRITGIRTGAPGNTATVEAQSNAATRRILADPTVVSANTSTTPVVERKQIDLVGNVAASVQQAAVPAHFGALPAVRGAWTRVTTNLAFTLTPVGASNAQFTAPGVYENSAEQFLFRAYYDLNIDAAFTAGEPDNTETVDVTIEPVRHRMVLVLDRSGSMSGTLTGGSEAKWNATLRAAHAWLDLFAAFRGPEGQKAGFLTFEDDTCGYGPAALADDVTLRNPSNGTATAGPLADLSTFANLTALNLGSPQTCTPIGDALVTAVQKLNAGPLGARDALTIFLLTDGRENAGATTVKASTADAPGSSSTFLTQLNSYSAVKDRLSIYALGMGSGTDEDTLNNLPALAGLGTGGGGYYHLTTNTQDLLDELETMIADSIEAQPTTVTVGANQATFTVNDGERKLAVLVPWSNSNDVLRLSHRAQGSGDAYQTLPAGPGLINRSRATHGIAIVDIPTALSALTNTGRDWKVERLAGGGAPGAISAAIAVVDLKVKAELSFDKVAYRTGEPMQLTCRVMHGGDPVPNATVKVTMDGAGEGVGTFLAVNGQKVQQKVNLYSIAAPGRDPVVTTTHIPTGPASGGDPAAAKAALFDHFLRENGLDELPRVVPLFTDGTDQLFDDGAHGDGAANDGVYGNTFAATSKEGTYRFKVRVTGDVAGSRFDRVIIVSKWVGVLVDPASSPVTLTALPPPGAGLQAVEVTVIPRDANGEYLGPGRLGEVKMSASSGTFASLVQTNIDGSYTATLHYPEGKEPTVVVQVGDVVIGSRPSDTGPGDGDDQRCGRLLHRALRCYLRKLLRWLKGLFRRKKR